MNRYPRWLNAALFALLLPSLFSADNARAVIQKAILTEKPAEQRALIASLAGQGDDAIPTLLTAWRTDALYIFAAPDGTKVPVQLTGAKDASDAQLALRVDTGDALKDAAGQPMRLAASDLTAVEHTSALRKAMKAVLDMIDLASSDVAKRLRSVQTIGQAQDAEKLPVLRNRLEVEKDSSVVA
ncbi:MAG TPA: hypothetical protein VFJ90_14390, partial [Candidatus Didemnitutus sp.]|nr:hypothetical protein [Candidatus Didemnitutus sp.]